MKVLMISTDRKIFEEGSEVFFRMIEYGKLFDELHIIILTQNAKLKFKNQNSKLKILENTFAYPTNSRSKFFYVYDAIKIGKKIIYNSKFKIYNSVITSQDPFETGFIGWWLAGKFKLPLQLQVHTDFLSHFFKKESFLNRIRVLLAKFLIKHADCIRVVSKRIKNSLLEIRNWKLEITVLPIFVDIEKIKNASITENLRAKYPQFEKIILMVSRLEKEKNISLAISVMKEVIKKYPKTGLVMVGDGRERDIIKNKIIKNKLENSIVLDGWQDKKTIYSYYKTADLFLLTSDYEGYGLVITEALACGLNVLSRDVGVAREVGATITDSDNMAQNIVKLLTDKSKTAELTDYPYKNRQEYLEKLKKSFEICAKSDFEQFTQK